MSYIDGDGSRQALDPAGLDLLRRKVFTDDLLTDIEKGREIPGGATKDEWLVEQQRINDLIEQVPPVKDALAKRKELWGRVGQDLADRGVISPENATNDLMA